MESIFSGIWWYTGRNFEWAFASKRPNIFAKLMQTNTYCLACDASHAVDSLSAGAEDQAKSHTAQHRRLYITIAFLAKQWESKINRVACWLSYFLPSEKFLVMLRTGKVVAVMLVGHGATIHTLRTKVKSEFFFSCQISFFPLDAVFAWAHTNFMAKYKIQTHI